MPEATSAKVEEFFLEMASADYDSRLRLHTARRVLKSIPCKSKSKLIFEQREAGQLLLLQPRVKNTRSEFAFIVENF